MNEFSATMLQILIRACNFTRSTQINSMSILKAIMDINGIHDGLKNTAVILLLTIYMCGSAGSGLFHRLFHGHESLIAHTPELEKDPCHRVVYHYEKDNVCQHESHFGVYETCGHCDILCNHDQITVRHDSNQTAQPGTFISVTLTFAESGETFLHRPSRAPPLT